NSLFVLHQHEGKNPEMYEVAEVDASELISGGTTVLRDPKRHVLVVAHAWYGDVIGGSFRLASELAESLANAGHRVTYVCCSPEAGPAPALETVGNVELRRYPLPARSLTVAGRLWSHVSRTARLVADVHRKSPIDVVCGHSPLQFWGATRALRRHRVVRNYTVHSPFDEEVLANTPAGELDLHTRARAVAAAWIDRCNLDAADRVQTISSYTLKTMTGKHGRRVQQKASVVPGWVDAERFRPAGPKHWLRQAKGEPWSEDVPVFFTLRRLERRMGLETLIEAAAHLRRTGYRFRVMIGGGGPLREELQRRIDEQELQECVKLLGRIPEEELPGCYAAADCFVLPTRSLECFGLIVLEAYAAGTPVIASRIAAIPELIRYQGEEWLFEPGNSWQLADRMHQFMDGELLPTRNLQRIADGYDQDAVLRQWHEAVMPETTCQ
ncbi:MAG: glycosyltransferase family 4 protein, partial [Maioricimonas sp. JB049]